jgi:hypothetical protein
MPDSLADLITRVEAIERQMRSLRVQAHEHEEYIDTVSSPIYKRVWWFCCGYHFRKVGRWYGN